MSQQSVYNQLQDKPLTMRDHQDPDKHWIGEGLAVPSQPATTDTIGNVSATGTSPFVARADHVHKLGNGVVDTTNIAAGAVTNQKLFNNTSSPYVATFNNLTIGNGTLNGRQCLLGCFQFFYIQLVFGTSTSITGSVTITNPPSNIYLPSNSTALSKVEFVDAGAATYSGTLAVGSATTFIIRRFFDSGIAGNPTQEAGLGATIPFVWGATDQLNISAFYLTA